MLGQTDTPEVEEVNLDPRSYQSKSVGKRMVIISAGVVMNILFGFVLFSTAYSFGVPYVPGVIGSAFPGLPAWKAGVREGDHLVAINDTKRDDFEDIRRQVMLANPKRDTIKFEMKRPQPEGSPADVEFNIRPFKDGSNLLPQIGVTPGLSLRLVRWADDDGARPPDSPVGRATNPGFQGGDQIESVDGKPVADYHSFNRLMYEKRRNEVTIAVRRDADKKQDGETVRVKVEPNFMRTFGLVMQIGKIEAVRPDSPAAKAINIETKEPMPLQAGDQIKKVNGEEDFDPMRLPDIISDKIGERVTLEIVREGRVTQTYRVEVTPDSIPPWNDYGEVSVFAGKESFPVSIPSIGVCYQVGRTVRKIVPGGPASKASPAIEPGDVIMAAEFPTDVIRKIENVSLTVENNWPQVFWNLQSGRVGKTFTFTLQRKDASDQSVKVKVDPVQDKTWSFHQRGFEFLTDQAVRQETTVAGALTRGLNQTKSAVRELYLILKQLVVGNMSMKSFSGPIQIGALTYQLTAERVGLLLWFVALLNINLAIFNFLPIPILDGGHMAFLIYEKIMGRQAPAKAVAVLNHVGFFLLIALMLYVFSLDILRLFGFVRM